MMAYLFKPENTILLSMNFEASEITQQVAHTARDFAQQHIKPHVMDWDESQEFPVHILKNWESLG